MIEKNQEFEVEISGMASEGQGIARVNGFVVFVPFAIVGEKVKIHIIKVTKSFAVGKIIEVLQKSNGRVLPQCPHFYKCGGCTLEHMSYESQLEFKRRVVQDALQKLGGFDNVKVNSVVGSENQFEYRNKSAFPLFEDETGKLRVCMFKEMSHNPIYIENCPITNQTNMKIAFAFQNVANEFFKTSKKDFLHIVIRTIENKSLVTIVTKKNIKNSSVMFDALKNQLNSTENEIGLFECIKKTDNNVILEGEVVHLAGLESIDFDILGIKTSVSPMSFFQVNIGVMKKIYEKVNELVTNDTVVDAYSGAGLMSAILAKSAKKVYGIEIVKDATADANRLKKQNGIENLENINGDTSFVLPNLEKEIGEYTLVLDPPRKGIDVSVANTICKSKPNAIVYVSCNPATLARDLKTICASGYEICLCQPYDMFPQTAHVETLVSLKRI